jgi:branched-chain amino acid transport system ATP-binding protein
MLETRKLTVRFGGSTILHDVDLRVEGFTGLVGRNGAGKTTLMRAVMGLIRTHSGHVLLNGQDITAVPAHRRTRAGVGYMPEDRRLIPGLTVEENLLLPAWGTRRPDGRDRCERALAYVSEVADMRSRRVEQLSGGQQKLVALARALVSGEQVLLLDEPFEGVAPALALRLSEVLANLQEEGTTVLISESDMDRAGSLFERTYLIERGAVEPWGSA